MESHYVVHNGSKLHYVKAGSGTHPLIFFHGFGQDHTIYVPIAQSVAKEYQLFVFDLYFHGKSVWAAGEKPLEKAVWKETFNSFLETHRINQFSLVGFSLGGKFALATLEAFPERIKNIFLIAPDGVKTSFWYSMATYPLIMRRFFRGMIENYDRFLKLANGLHKMKLVDQGLVRFADYQMGTTEKRKRVYYSWVVFRHLNFNIRKIARLINTHDIETTVIVGEYDKVIVPENMNVLVNQLKHVTFEVLPYGHSGLIYPSLRFIREKG